MLAREAAAFQAARLVYAREAGAEHCGSEAALRQAVAARLGYDPFFAGAAGTIVARIRREQDVLRATVELVDASGVVRGQRELDAPATLCSELLSGMALAISIAIDPSSLDRVQRRPAEPDEAIDAPAPPLRTSPPAEAPGRDHGRGAAEPPTRDARWMPELEIGVAASSGLAPSVGVGPRVLFGLRRAWWSTGAELRYQFVRDRAATTGFVSSSLAEAALLACGHPDVMFFCAELSAGSLQVSGMGVARPNSDTALVWRSGVRAGVEIRPTAKLGARLHSDLLFNLGSQAVELDGRREWTSPRIAVLGGAALYGRFP